MNPWKKDKIANAPAPALVSIIIPMYGVEQYLKKCLDSVVHQTMKDIEIICVDDGSPDRSGEIAEEYAAQFPNVRVIHQANSGISATRNTGFDAATGRYVYFLDSDDWLEPEAMEELYTKAEETQAEIVSFDSRVVFANEEAKAAKPVDYEKAYIRSRTYEGVYSGPELASLMRPNGDWHNAVWLALIRRDFLIKHNIRFYPGVISGEDHLYAFLCAMHAERVAFVDKIYHNYYVRTRSLTTTKISNEQMEGEIICFLEMLDFLKKHSIDPRYELTAYRWVHHILTKGCKEYQKSVSLGVVPEIKLGRADEKAVMFVIKKVVERDNKIKKLTKTNKELDEKVKNLTKANKELKKKYQIYANREDKLLYIPRKICGGIRCLKQHGLCYTLSNIRKKVYARMQKQADKS